jgi:hypothetical protein
MVMVRRPAVEETAGGMRQRRHAAADRRQTAEFWRETLTYERYIHSRPRDQLVNVKLPVCELFFSEIIRCLRRQSTIDIRHSTKYCKCKDLLITNSNRDQ